MTGWGERATALRAVLARREGFAAAPSAAPDGPDAALPQQAAFARKVVEEIILPVASEFAQIVTGEPGTPAVHTYHRGTVGLTCDLDSRRFAVNVFLLPQAKVRIAVSLAPSQTAGWHKDFRLDTPNEEIEEWFGTALARLYEAT